MEILYDKKENLEEIYRLWQEAFHDPDAFADYYFKQVYPGNQVIVGKEGNHICSMLHLNPYHWKWKEGLQLGQEEMLELHYIVGVATEETYRRQGLMASCLKKALQDMEANGEPFTYLMPANPAYYEPFQFVMWKEEKRWKWSEKPTPEWRYSIFPARTETYLTRLQSEVQCEAGDIIHGEAGAYAAYIIDHQKKKIIIQQVFEGYLKDIGQECNRQCSFWQQVVSQLNERYDGMDIEVVEAQPMMLRILNLQRFISLLPYKGEVKQLLIKVRDDICKTNEGSVRIILAEEGCRLEKLEHLDEGVSVLEWNIGQLAQYLLQESHLAEYVYLMEIV